jgi:very-short-patch-repair endonuclease
MDADAVLGGRIEGTHGVFRVRDARAAGLTRNQVEHRVETGRWVTLHPGVFRLRGVAPTWKGKLLAACWAGGGRAVASRRSAAALHGLPGGKRDFAEITTPRWRRTRHDGVTVHESTRLDPCDVEVVDGVPVTTVGRTLFDLGGVYGRGMVEYALENALRRGLITLPALEATLHRLSRRGRAGGPVLRHLLEARRVRSSPTESEMETKLLRILEAAGLPRPSVQHEVWVGNRFVGRVDLAYPKARIAVEYDSDEFHSGRRATRRDRARRHELIAAGWLPVDIGPAELRDGAIGACAAVATALTTRTCVDLPE